MKKISLIVAGAIIASAANLAVADSKAGAIYGGLDLGYGMTPGKITAYAGTAATLNGELKADGKTSNKYKGSSNGFMITPKVGYQITDEIRTDLSFTYMFDQKSKIKEGDLGKMVNAPAGTAAATYHDLKSAAPELKRSSWFAMANITYSFLNSSDFEPFVGVGIGYGATTYSVEKMEDKAKTTGLLLAKEPKISTPAAADDTDKNFLGNLVKLDSGKSKKTKSGFVYGATLGVSYKINSNFAMDLSYGFRSLPKAETKFNTIAAATGATTNGVVLGDVATTYKAPSLLHSINLGARFYF